MAEQYVEAEQVFLQYYSATEKPVTVQADGGVSMDADVDGITLATDGRRLRGRVR